MTNEERIYELIESAYSLAVTATNRITELKQENSKLKQRVAEFEKPKKKRKFRAMTNMEYCISYACEENFSCLNCSLYRYSSTCVLGDDISNSKKPFKTKDGKYIFVEVRE